MDLQHYNYEKLINKKELFESALFLFAEEKGFEPLIRFPVYTLSRRASSTTPALFRTWVEIRAAKIQLQGQIANIFFRIPVCMFRHCF